MERLSDAVQKIKTVLFGERQRGMPENRVFLDRETLLALFEDWEHHDRDLRVLYVKNQRLETENSNLQAERDALAAQVEMLIDAGNEVYAELQQWALCESHEETEIAYKYWLAARSKVPQQCLADVKAEAVMKAVQFFKPARDIDAESLEAYAAKLRQGGDQ